MCGAQSVCLSLGIACLAGMYWMGSASGASDVPLGCRPTTGSVGANKTEPAQKDSPPCQPAESTKSTATVFVGVGAGGRRVFSADGKTWVVTAEDDPKMVTDFKGFRDPARLVDVAYGQGRFVAVGGSWYPKGKGRILLSSDGKTWREVYSTTGPITAVGYGNGRFIAASSIKKLLVSEDGEKWTTGAQPQVTGNVVVSSIAFGNGVFVLAGTGSRGSHYNCVYTTTDGTEIENFREVPHQKKLVFGVGRFVLVGADAMRMSTVDGREWSNDEKGTNDLFWAVATDTGIMTGGGRTGFVSLDGKSWTKWPVELPCYVRVVTNGVWVGSSNDGQMWHSTDGRTWKADDKLPRGIIFEVAAGVPEAVLKPSLPSP